MARASASPDRSTSPRQLRAENRARLRHRNNTPDSPDDDDDDDSNHGAPGGAGIGALRSLNRSLSNESLPPELGPDPGHLKHAAALSAILFMLLLLAIPPDWAGAGLRSPIIIVPGLGGSQMEARLVNKKSTPSLLCSDLWALRGAGLHQPLREPR